MSIRLSTTFDSTKICAWHDGSFFEHASATLIEHEQLVAAGALGTAKAVQEAEEN